MLVYNNRVVLGECLAVPGQLKPCPTVLAMSTSNNGLGVIQSHRRDHSGVHLV